MKLPLFTRNPRLAATLLTITALLSVLVTACRPARAATPGPGGAPGAEVVAFDVAEDASRFVFDEAPVFEDGLPAHGNAFVTQGYIYPAGTLEGGNGVEADGSPEFPGEVLGSWTCRGWFVGDGAHTETGAWVITTQLYELGTEPGATTLVSEGIELADAGEAVRRAVTGGTGRYAAARGEAQQTLLGFNAAEGVNLRFEITVRTP